MKSISRVVSLFYLPLLATAGAAASADHRLLQNETLAEDGYCDEVTPCSVSPWTGRNMFCFFTSEETSGFCSQCSYDPPPLDECSKAWNKKSMESCVNQCIDPEHTCSKEKPCPDGQFCGYQLGDSGYCTACDEVTYPAMCNQYLGNPDGQAECRSTCSLSCSANVPCPESMFCDFYNNSQEGNCSPCNVLSSLQSCESEQFFEDMTENQKGITSCIESCFDPCLQGAMGGAACSDGFFCSRSGNSTNEGFCDKCETYRNFESCDDTHRDPANVAECASVCLGECSQDSPCNGSTISDDDSSSSSSFCNFQDGDSGYCDSCEWSAWSASLCSRFPPQGELSCVESCFDFCDSNTTCPLDSDYNEPQFCNYRTNATFGACDGCWRASSVSECSKFAPQGELSCVESCFDYCDSNTTCPLDSDFNEPQFCNYGTNATFGGCDGCWGRSQPSDCDEISTTEGRASCRSTCFIPCGFSFGPSDCPDYYTYCKCPDNNPYCNKGEGFCAGWWIPTTSTTSRGLAVLASSFLTIPSVILSFFLSK